MVDVECVGSRVQTYIASSSPSSNQSSILTYSVVARVSKSGFMPKVLQDRGLWTTPSLDTLTPQIVDRLHALELIV